MVLSKCPLKSHSTEHTSPEVTSWELREAHKQMLGILLFLFAPHPACTCDACMTPLLMAACCVVMFTVQQAFQLAEQSPPSCSRPHQMMASALHAETKVHLPTALVLLGDSYFICLKALTCTLPLTPLQAVKIALQAIDAAVVSRGMFHCTSWLRLP